MSLEVNISENPKRLNSIRSQCRVIYLAAGRAGNGVRTQRERLKGAEKTNFWIKKTEWTLNIFQHSKGDQVIVFAFKKKRTSEA